MGKRAAAKGIGKSVVADEMESSELKIAPETVGQVEGQPDPSADFEAAIATAVEDPPAAVVEEPAAVAAEPVATESAATETTATPVEERPAIPSPSQNGKPSSAAKAAYDPSQWLTEIQIQNHKVQVASADWESAKTIAKARKTAHEEAVARLSKLIADQEQAQADWNKPLPLFDAGDLDAVATIKDGAAKDATPVVVGPNAWRFASIAELNLPGKLAEKLNDNGIQTIGELEDFRAKPGGLNSIKGLGVAKITTIEDAQISWLSAQRDAKALAAAGSSTAKEAAEVELEDSGTTGAGDGDTDFNDI